MECGKPSSSSLLQGSVGEQRSCSSKSLAIWSGVCAWTLIWRLNFSYILGILYLPPCWLVSTRYVLFQGLDTTVTFCLLFLHVKDSVMFAVKEQKMEVSETVGF